MAAQTSGCLSMVLLLLVGAYAPRGSRRLRGTLTENSTLSRRRLQPTSNSPPGIDWGPPDQSLVTSGDRCPYGAGCTCCNAERYDDFCTNNHWGCRGIAYCGCESGYLCAGKAFGEGLIVGEVLHAIGWMACCLCHEVPDAAAEVHVLELPVG